jgi:signal transduction histidine kinase/DNA-binding response OmpR family regulator
MSEFNSSACHTQPLAVLMVEDSDADAELCVRELKKSGFEPRVDVVQTAREFGAHLSDGSYHVILADFTLPAWNGLEALELLRKMDKEIPLIIVTGTMREEQAAEWLRKGAADFVLKDRLSRLGPAVRLALERKALREDCARLEQKCRETEQRLERLAAFPKLNPNPVLEFSNEGALTYCNDAAVELARSLGREHPSAVLPPDCATIVRTCLVSGQKRLGVESALGGRTFSWSFFPIQASQVVHCYVIDITERQHLEAQLRHSQKLESVGRLAAGIAHDFNNVLTVVQGHIGLLRCEAELSQTGKESVQQIARVAERAGKLTSQLLAFSRRNVMAPRQLDLNEILTGISSLLHRTLGEDITYQFDYASALPAVYADAGMIEQIIMNIAVNARDAMPKGGQLVISTALVEVDESYVQRHPAEARPGQFVCLSIADTGCGMDNVTLSRMFEPFFTTKEFGKGTGLGLATVYGIVKQHKGWIEVQSQVGQGSTFKIYLPPSDKTADKQSGKPADDKVPRGTETILVVEDEPPVRFIIKGVLERYGYKILEAANGVEALALWHQHHSDIALLLTDMVMPVGLSGQELGEKFSAQKPGLKVMYVSGYSLQVAGKGFAVMEGINFLQKPFDGTRLAFAVRHCLDS